MMRRHLRLILAFTAIPLAAAIIFSGATRWPSGHAEGGPITPTPEEAAQRSAQLAESPTTRASGSLTGSSTSTDLAAPTRLRLAAFNIHSGRGLDDRFDLDRTAAVLKGCDLISIHEARGAGPWWSNSVDVLAGKLKMSGLFSPVEIWWWHPWFGNGILTDTRITHWERTPLPTTPGMAYRDVVTLQVPFGSGTLNVLMVHMAKKSDHARAFAVAADMFRKLPEPAIMMGDMNTRADDPAMQALLHSGDVQDPVGQSVKRPPECVDFILTRGVAWHHAGLVTNDASDHPMVWADIEAIP